MNENKIAVAFIGCGIEDVDGGSSASSRAGQLFQEGILQGLIQAGVVPTIISVSPISSFPKSKTLFVKRRIETTSIGTPINLVPFMNITPLKQILIGCAVIYEIFRWRIKTRGCRYHIVHTYNLTVPPGVFSWFAARMMGAKFSVSLNDIHMPGDTTSNKWAAYIDFWLHRFLIPKVDMRFAVSDSIAKDFMKGGDYCRMEGGVNNHVVQFFEGSRRKLDDGRVKIAFAGSLDAPNGIAILLKALSLLPSKSIELLIAGDGPLREEVVAASQKDHRISYLGLLPFKEVLALYARVDLLLNIRVTRELNTKYFFPSKMMEYMASGTPVLTTATGHVSEEFGDFVYLLEDESPEGLASKLDELLALRPEVRLQRSSRARLYMIANKTWKAQGARMVRFWNQKLQSELSFGNSHSRSDSNV